MFAKWLKQLAAQYIMLAEATSFAIKGVDLQAIKGQPARTDDDGVEHPAVEPVYDTLKAYCFPENIMAISIKRLALKEDYKFPAARPTALFPELAW